MASDAGSDEEDGDEDEADMDDDDQSFASVDDLEGPPTIYYAIPRH